MEIFLIRWNKDVGYCQGFNMLAAIILEVMDKSEADSLKVNKYYKLFNSTLSTSNTYHPKLCTYKVCTDSTLYLDLIKTQINYRNRNESYNRNNILLMHLRYQIIVLF